MPKPIVVLYLPDAHHFGPDPGELMSAFNDNHNEIKMAPMFYDYLWFVFVNEELVAPELKVFHEKDYTEAQYDELKSMLEEGIKSLKIKTNE